ncbi:MAG: hypothetical protein CMH57_00585 [Myxococcales bacterium]|nr:hypothetical protein [Myxococcales bacterium]
MSSHVPEGFQTIVPYLFVDDPEGFVAFLVEAFDASSVKMHYEPEDVLRHGEVSVLGSVLELSQARPECPATAVHLHAFVPDADAAYARALAAGATSIYAPTDHDYGERSGGVRDRWGNRWYLATVTDAEKRAGG